MKKLTLCLVALAALAFGSQAFAVINTVDDVPAATLLVPYFELDLDNSNGVTTLFAIGNASAASQLAHVTVWSTQSIPVLDFDVYLTGYDIQTFNIRDILVNGILPQTGFGTTTAQEPGSNKGAYSFAKVNFPNCNATNAPPVPPVYTIPAISVNFRAHLQALLTGKKSPIDGTCAGYNKGDNIARGYITIDDANSCSLLFPSSTGYFINGGLGIADNDNVLWGDYFYVDSANNFAQGETMVHVEADAAVINTPGEYSFYGRYILGTAADNREPLATTFASRYIEGGAFNGGTSLIVWRDSKFTPGVSCTTGANYGDLFAGQVVIFDEEENPVTIVTGGPSGEPTPGAVCDPFCDEAQRADVSTLNPAQPFGWIYLNLNHATSRDATLGAGYINIAQAWVTTVMDASGRFSVGYDAIQLDNANSARSGGVQLPVTP